MQAKWIKLDLEYKYCNISCTTCTFEQTRYISDTGLRLRPEPYRTRCNNYILIADGQQM